MSSSTIAKASRVERAVERLEASVDRLDRALANGADPANVPVDNAALENLRSENDELRDLNQIAADRLAAVIQRLDGLLAENRDA